MSISRIITIHGSTNIHVLFKLKIMSLCACFLPRILASTKCKHYIDSQLRVYKNHIYYGGNAWTKHLSQSRALCWSSRIISRSKKALGDGAHWQATSSVTINWALTLGLGSDLLVSIVLSKYRSFWGVEIFWYFGDGQEASDKEFQSAALASRSC